MRGQAGLGGSSDLQDAARGGLYEPVQRVYKEYAERLGVQTQGLTFPSFSDPVAQASDGSFDALPQPPQLVQATELEATDQNTIQKGFPRTFRVTNRSREKARLDTIEGVTRFLYEHPDLCCFYAKPPTEKPNIASEQAF